MVGFRQILSLWATLLVLNFEVFMYFRGDNFDLYIITSLNKFLKSLCYNFDL